MVAVSDSTKIVKFPYRPVGFKAQEGKEVTVGDIRDWVKKENPNIIKCLPHFAIWTAIGTIISTILGFVGIKKDSKLCKWFGGILGLVGIVSSGFGVYLARAVNQIPEKEKKAEEEQEKKSKNDFRKILETSIVNSLKSISEKNEAQRDGSRRNLISTHFSDTTKAKAVFEKIKSGNVDEKIRKEAEHCLDLIHKEEQRLPNMIASLKNKSLDPSARTRVIDELIQEDLPKAIEALISISTDKNDIPEVRITCMNNLGIQVERLNQHISALDKQKIRKALTNCMCDKTDNPKVRSNAIFNCSFRHEYLEFPINELLDLSLERLKDNDDIEVYESAAKVLGKYCNKEILQALEVLIEEVNRKMANEGVRNLSRANARYFNALTNAVEAIKKRIPERS